jgi:hypothetical protein
MHGLVLLKETLTSWDSGKREHMSSMDGLEGVQGKLILN